MKEAKTLGRMMKEDNVVGRLKESVERFGSGFKQSLRSEGGSNLVPGASKLIGVGEGEQQDQGYSGGSIRLLSCGKGSA